MTDLEEKALSDGWVKTKNGSFKRNGRYGCKAICKTCNREFIGSLKTVKYCSKECKPSPKKKTKIEYKDVIKIFNDEGYKVLTTKSEWDNKQQLVCYYKIKFICPNGHRYSMTYASFKVGQRCKLCSKSAPVTWNDVIDLFENQKGWKVLTKEKEWNDAYKDKVKFQCSKGHVHSYTYTSLKHRNHSCPYCKHTIKIRYKDIKKSMEDEGWTVLSTKDDYKNQNETPIKCVCPNGHVQNKSVRKWRMGRRCPYCITSGPELELRKYIENLEIEYVPNYRGFGGVELDIWMPDTNRAIEFNGDYWHCNPSKYDQSYYNDHKELYAYEIWERDKSKQRVCKDNGVSLMIVWENEWKHSKKDTRARIKEFIN